MGADVDAMSDDDVRAGIKMQGEGFRDNAPMTSAEAATVILNGVKEERWRILVGDDAHKLDERVRADPEAAYEMEFFEGNLLQGGATKE